MTSIDGPLFLETAAKHGVPASVVRELTARTRPRLSLVRHGELPEPSRENARPAARTGGLPALPDGVNWPEVRGPLVLSVDCAVLPQGALDIELPAEGHLLFFTEVEYPPEQSALLHIPAEAPTTGRPAGDIRVYEPRTLYPVPGLSFDGESDGGPRTRALRPSPRCPRAARRILRLLGHGGDTGGDRRRGVRRARVRAAVLTARRRVPWPVHAPARPDPPFSCPALPSLR
ncbi:YwqG family protein [Streptomyces sp. AD2-2]|nr:YwqG family protein [Streptomyces sp. AD2-2]